MRVVAIGRDNVAQVLRWRGVRSGTRRYLQAFLEGEWCQVVETRSDPDCLPPRSQRARAGEYAWQPPGAAAGDRG